MLYVKFAQEKRPRTVKMFLKQFYTNRVDPYIAIGHTTYHDHECTRRHCSLSYRSFDDLYDMVRTYYPSIRKKKMIHYLLTTNIPIGDGRRSKPHLGICGGMGRIRFIPYREMNVDHNHLNRRMPNSTHTWMELLNLLGIKNSKELEEYVENNKEP